MDLVKGHVFVHIFLCQFSFDDMYQVIGIEPTESNILSGGKPGKMKFNFYGHSLSV